MKRKDCIILIFLLYCVGMDRLILQCWKNIHAGNEMQSGHNMHNNIYGLTFLLDETKNRHAFQTLGRISANE